MGGCICSVPRQNKQIERRTQYINCVQILSPTKPNQKELLKNQTNKQLKNISNPQDISPRKINKQNITDNPSIFKKNMEIKDQVILGQKDQRYEIKENSQEKKKYPYDCIGLIKFDIRYYLERKLETIKGVGTGFLISKNLVLTCCHNIYNKQRQQHAQIIAFRIQNEDYQVQDFIFPQQFQIKKNHKQKQLDYALLKTSKNIIRQKYIELAYNYSYKDSEVEIFGYNYDLRQDISFFKGHKQIIIGVQAGLIKHRIDTTQGQSGAPILFEIVQMEDKKCAIGIHLAQSHLAQSNIKYNIGLQFTEYFIGQLRKMEKKLTKSKFEEFVCVDISEVKLEKIQLEKKQEPIQNQSSQSSLILQDHVQQALQYFKKGIQNETHHDYEMAIINYKQSLYFLTLTNSKKDIISSLNHNIGNCYFSIYNILLANQYLLQTYNLKINTYGDGNQSVADTAFSLGTNFYITEGLEYYQKALYIYRSKRLVDKEIQVLNNMSILQKNLRKTYQAKQIYININEISSSLKPYISSDSADLFSIIANSHFQMNLLGKSLEKYYNFFRIMKNLELLQDKDMKQFKKFKKLVDEVIKSGKKQWALKAIYVLKELFPGDNLLKQLTQLKESKKWS